MTMRVLNVNHTLDPVSGGGTAERTLQISRFMAEGGADCAVLSMDVGLDTSVSERLGKVRLHKLPCLNRRFFLPSPFALAMVEQAVMAADLVHIMNHWALLNVMVARMAVEHRIPYVVCPAGALPIYGRSRMLKTLYNQILGKRIIRSANGHIAISYNEIPQFEKYGVQEESITVIPNGIDPEDFVERDTDGFRRRHRLGENPFLLFVGRLNHIKGPDLLLRAFMKASSSLPEYNLVFIGPDGGMQEELRKVAERSEVQDRIHFLGYLGGREKSYAYHAADLLVVPSRQEAMSIVALEAGACAIPVLLTNQCGFDAIEKSGGGKVVPATISGLCQGLMAMCQGDLKGMGRSLEDFVLAEYTWPAMVKEYLQYFQIVLENKKERDKKLGFQTKYG